MKLKTQLYWHDYNYFPYERELAFKEIESLFSPSSIKKGKDLIIVSHDKKSISELERLAYFGSFKYNGRQHNTIQSQLESEGRDISKRKKQATRYSVHGIHEYKGKFNPQIVRGILNIFNISPGETVIDPFCGSGTTLVECAHSSINSVGTDINPLAVFVTNAKISAINVKTDKLELIYSEILENVNTRLKKKIKLDKSTDRSIYLSKWFDEYHFNVIELLRTEIEALPPSIRAVFQILVSDILRDYSLQEPADLRIRKRRTSLPDTPLLEALTKRFLIFLERISSAQQIIGKLEVDIKAYKADCRQYNNCQERWRIKPLYDAAITSPPYATALPYIDTQRLSLVWLSLIQPSAINSYEAMLTGSREFSRGGKYTWIDSLINNDADITRSIHKFCLNLQNNLGADDGFRKQATPALLYRYFFDMKRMFINMKTVLKKNAMFALVVGHNQTTIGGEKYDIDTPHMLKDLAKSLGWSHQESIPLQTYHRYGLHKNNSVKAETLLILKNAN